MKGVEGRKAAASNPNKQKDGIPNPILRDKF